MHGSVIDQRDGSRIDEHAVHHRGGHAGVPTAGILHGDLVPGPSVAPSNDKTLPGAGNARLHREAAAPALEPENGFEAEPVHPRGRTRVPGPSSSTDVR